MTGAEAVIKTLEAHGVEYIFGYSGGAAIPFFDALETTKTNIQLIATRQEQGAAHMADGYARVSGEPCVVLVTSGPGAGNIVTGLMTAQMDSVPMIAICGQQITGALGYDAFQEADVMNMTMPVVKHSFAVHDTSELSDVVAQAWHIATSGRPGPVLIDVPKDISSAEFTGTISHPLPASSPSAPDAKKIQHIIEAWRTAKKPVILAGHGILISGGEGELVRLAEATNTPVVTTLLGKGVIDEHHPLSLGMLGMHGTERANTAILECDFLLNIGSRFDDRIVGKASEFCKNAFKAHVDIDPSELNKTIEVDVAVEADANSAITAFYTKISAMKVSAPGPDLKAPPTSLEQALGSAGYPPFGHPDETPHTAKSARLTMQYVIQKLDHLARPETIIATDVGQHQMWAALHYRTTHANTWLSSGGAGTMGFGFPAALGAQFAKPTQPVIAIVGDGGFQMTMAEIATACVFNLPVKVIILNNHYLGMVRQWQELFFDNRESGVAMPGNPDFVKLAESYGAKGVYIADQNELDEKLSAALADKQFTIINIEVEKTDSVFPMIPAGAPYTAMIAKPPSEKLAKPTGST